MKIFEKDDSRDLRRRRERRILPMRMKRIECCVQCSRLHCESSELICLVCTVEDTWKTMNQDSSSSTCHALLSEIRTYRDTLSLLFDKTRRKLDKLTSICPKARSSVISIFEGYHEAGILRFRILPARQDVDKEKANSRFEPVSPFCYFIFPLESEQTNEKRRWFPTLLSSSLPAIPMYKLI